MTQQEKTPMILLRDSYLCGWDTVDIRAWPGYGIASEHGQLAQWQLMVAPTDDAALVGQKELV